MRRQRIAAIVLRQLYLLRGSPARVVPLFAWVAIDVVLWGFISRFLSTITTAGFRLIPALLGAVLLWDFLTRVMQGVTMTFFEDVWSRNFLNVFASPITVWEYVSGLVASGVVTSFIGVVVMVAVARLAFGLSLLVYGPMFAAFMAVLFVFGVALGIFGCAVVLRLGPAAEWFVWPIPAVISPFAGAIYPLSTLPAWMQAVARLMPPSYVFEAMRAIISGRQPSPGGLLWGAGLSLLALVGACWFFSRIHRNAVRTGLLARYSAETVA
jgi:ABC-2 type transport system permease protein